MSELAPIPTHEMMRSVNPLTSVNHPKNPDVKRFAEKAVFLDVISDPLMIEVGQDSDADLVQRVLLQLRFTYTSLRSDSFFERFVQWATQNGHLPQK